MVAHEAQVLLRGYHNTPDVARDINADLLFALTNQSLLIVSKFLEIWDPFGSLGASNERVRQLRAALQPIIDRIRVWPGLEQFRNTAIAHPYLTKNKELVGPWELIADHKAPTFHAEVVLLLFLVDSAVEALLATFYNEYAPLRALLRSQLPEPNAGPGIRLGTEIAPEQHRVVAEANRRLREMGVRGAPELRAEFVASRTRASRQ